MAAASKPLKKDGVGIFAVGTEPKANKEQIDQIASDKDNAFYLPAYRLPEQSYKVISRQFDHIREKRQRTSKIVHTVLSECIMLHYLLLDNICDE